MRVRVSQAPMQNIIDALKQKTAIYDEEIVYCPDLYPGITFKEFKKFTHDIFENEGGGWENVKKYLYEDIFETYHIPFERDNEKFWLIIMYGQGSSYTLMTDDHFKEHLVWLNELKEKEKFGKLTLDDYANIAKNH